MSSWFTVLRHLLRRTEQIAPHIEGRFLPGGLGEPDQFETITIIDNEPHLINPEPVARERWQPPGITRHPKIQPLGEDLWGTTFAIEYRDAQGRVSFRRITIRELYRASEDNTLYLQCFCHERQAIRSFRFDRIVSVIDLDGEIHEPRSFFENELRVEIPTAKITPPKIRERTPPQLGNAEKAGHSQRAVVRDGLRVLIALSRADSFCIRPNLMWS